MGQDSAGQETEIVRWREGPLAELLDPRTYRVTLYVLLALPAGLAAFVLIVGGVVGGVITLPFLVGAPILLGTLWLVGALTELQRYLAGLLGVQFGRAALPSAYAGVLPWLRATLADPATYRALLFHTIQLPLALLSWAVLGLLGVGMALGLSAPLWIRLSQASLPPLTWGDNTLYILPGALPGLLLLGLGLLLLAGGVTNLIGRVWVRLCVGLLGRDPGDEAMRREVVALRQAAGRVALGDDLEATLTDLVAQAQRASTAGAVALVMPSGAVQASTTADDELNDLLGGVPDDLPAPGQASVQALPGGRVLAVLPVTLPPSAGLAGGVALRASYAPGQRPSDDELAFLLSMADHAGTALHAAHLIERAGARAGEQERARLARELHDSVAQALYGITLGAKTARATLDNPARAQASLDYTINLAEGGVAEMKALLFSLRPDALEEGGLVAALTQHARALEARHGLTVHTDLNHEPPLPPDTQAAVYRIAQEALHNVVKHARAGQVWLGLVQDELVQDEGGVTLTVRDDGRGFDPAAQGRGTLGQRSMRERAAGLGATLNVQSAPGAGTLITLHLPAPLLLLPAEAQPSETHPAEAKP